MVPRATCHDALRRLEVSSPAPSVLRLRHAPLAAFTSVRFPELPPRRSEAVVVHETLPLDRVREGTGLQVQAGDLELEAAGPAGPWRIAAGEREIVRCLGVRGDRRGGYPVPLHRTAIDLAAPPGEAYLGLGEKTGPLDRRGLHLTFWNTDVLPHQPDTDPLYVSIPFVLAIRERRAFGFLVDETWRCEVDLARDDPRRITWTCAGPELDVYVIDGPHPEDVVRRLAALTGRAPPPPLWSLGMQQSRWGYESQDEVLEVIRAYRAHGLPLDAVYLDLDHMDGHRPFTWSESRFPDPAALCRDAGEHGVRVVTIVDPGLKVDPGWAPYDEAVRRRLLVEDDRGDPVAGEVWPRRAVFPDLSREEVRAYWAGLHAPLLEAGVAGIWNDMNEPSARRVERGEPLSTTALSRGLEDAIEGPTLPYDARHGERRHVEVHNAYALGMAKAAHEAQKGNAPERRPFVLSRAGSTGIQRFAAVWTGDNSSTFVHLEMSIPMLLGMSVSGLPFVGADVPGFLGSATGELLARWFQLATFYPLCRAHSARGTPPKEPWRMGEPWLSIARAALERRYRLLPHLYTLMHEAATGGLPPLRPLALHDPGEREIAAFDQLLLGRDLLVAPVVRPGQVSRRAWLPAGAWLQLAEIDLGGEVEAGGRDVIAAAPLGRVPMWLRAGGALPFTRPAPHTTSARWAELGWLVHAGAELRGALHEDGGDGHGPWRRTILSGGMDGAALVIERRVEGELPPSRPRERMIVHGAPGSSVEGARARPRGGAIELELEESASRVVIR